MATIVKGKICLCQTSLNDWMPEKVNGVLFYERYQEFLRLFLAKIPDVNFEKCFAQPVYNDETKEVEWFILPMEEHPSTLKEEPETKAEEEKKRIINAIKKASKTLSDNDMRYLNPILVTLLSDKVDDVTYHCNGNVVFAIWGMNLKKGKEVTEVITGVGKDSRFHHITYTVEGNGKLSFSEIVRKHNHILGGETDVPVCTPEKGYLLEKWLPESPSGTRVTKPLNYVAVFVKDPNYKEESIDTPVDGETGDTEIPEPEKIKVHNVTFQGGEHGSMDGQSAQQVEHGMFLAQAHIPSIKSEKGWQFTGWDHPTDLPITEDVVYVAQYKQQPKRKWFAFLFGDAWRSCLGKLLRILMGLLLTLLVVYLLSLLLKGCDKKSTAEPIYPPSPIPVNPGDTVHDPITQRPIVSNRLNILIVSDDLEVDQVCQDFKELFPAPKYDILYADPMTKRIQVSVPEDERQSLNESMEGTFIEHFPERYQEGDIYVFDEAMLNISAYVPNDPKLDECWYLDAIQAKEAWEYTMGSEDIVVAIVDNGFNVDHEEFRGKVHKPYNVYTRSNDVKADPNVDHGTHVAGLAVASADNSKGISGIAPKCKLMPVKVADDYGNIYTSAMVDGMLYAAYNGADVINMSLGTGFAFPLPEPIQREWAQRQFIAEQKLWEKVFQITSKANAVVVLSAGNSNILTEVDPIHRSTNTFIVSAVCNVHDPYYHKADFSNYGPCTTISAPGVDILSTVHDSRYELMDGTSMAAPIVAGAVALIKSEKRDLTTMQIRDILQSTAIPTVGNIANLLQLGDAIRKAKDIEPDTTTTPELHSGDIELTLRWNNYNDIDLACIEPNGTKINYQNRTSYTGGMLEVDMNVEGRMSITPLEHIYWPDNSAEHGKYKVTVHYYGHHPEAEDITPYELTITKYKRDTTRYTGVLDREKEKHEVSFDL